MVGGSRPGSDIQAPAREPFWTAGLGTKAAVGPVLGIKNSVLQYLFCGRSHRRVGARLLALLCCVSPSGITTITTKEICQSLFVAAPGRPAPQRKYAAQFPPHQGPDYPEFGGRPSIFAPCALFQPPLR